MYLVQLTEEEKAIIEKALTLKVVTDSKDRKPETVITTTERVLLKIAKLDKEQG